MLSKTKFAHGEQIINENRRENMKMAYTNIRSLYQYRKGFVVGIVLSLFMVLSVNALNMTAHYAMGLKEAELTKYYQARDTIIEDKSAMVFNEYITNHKNDTTAEAPIYTNIVAEANEIMKQYYGK